MRIIIKIALTVVVLIIATFLIGVIKAGTGSNYLGLLGLLIGVGLIIGIVAIWTNKPQIKFHNKNETEANQIIVVKQPMKQKTENPLFQISIQKDKLKDLKMANLLSDDEFELKMETLKTKEDEITRINTEEYIEKIQNELNKFAEEQIKPIVDSLNLLLESGVLTQQEYNSKRGQLFNEKYQQIFSIPYLSSNNSLLINSLQKRSLPAWMISDIDNTIPKMKIGEVIALNKKNNKLHKLSFDQFLQINDSTNIGDWVYIEIPGLFEDFRLLNKSKSNIL